MKPEIKQLWVNALRSGEYKQGTGRLRTTDDAGDRFCCLGVLCDLYQKETGQGKWVSNATCLPKLVEKWADFYGYTHLGPEHLYLAYYNDERKLSFNEIADLIEKEA